jgi:hypothetical protein
MEPVEGLALFLTADFADYTGICLNLFISKSLYHIAHFDIGFVFHFSVFYILPSVFFRYGLALFFNHGFHGICGFLT